MNITNFTIQIKLASELGDRIAEKSIPQDVTNQFLQALEFVDCNDFTDSVEFFLSKDDDSDYYIVAKNYENDYVKWFSPLGVQIPEADISFKYNYPLTTINI